MKASDEEILAKESGAKVGSIPSPAAFGFADSDKWYTVNADTPIDPDTLLTDNLNLFSDLHSVRTQASEQEETASDDWKKAKGPVDYIFRLIRHDGDIVIPLFCLLVILFVMSFYALLNGRKTGGQRK